MAKFAKIFDLPNDNQVLVTLDYNSDENINNITFRSKFKGIDGSVALGYDDKEEAQEVFDKVNQEQAERVIDDIIKLLN